MQISLKWILFLVGVMMAMATPSFAYDFMLNVNNQSQYPLQVSIDATCGSKNEQVYRNVDPKTNTTVRYDCETDMSASFTAMPHKQGISVENPVEGQVSCKQRRCRWYARGLNFEAMKISSRGRFIRRFCRGTGTFIQNGDDPPRLTLHKFRLDLPFNRSGKCPL